MAHFDGARRGIDPQIAGETDGTAAGAYDVATRDTTVVWQDPEFDLSPWAGKTVKIELVALRTQTEFYRLTHTSYWSDIEIRSLDKPEPWK